MVEAIRRIFVSIKRGKRAWHYLFKIVSSNKTIYFFIVIFRNVMLKFEIRFMLVTYAFLNRNFILATETYNK